MANEFNAHKKIAMQLELDLSNALRECEHISDLVEIGHMLDIMALVLHIKRGYDKYVSDFLKKNEKYLGKSFSDIMPDIKNRSNVLNEIYDEYKALLEETQK